MASDSRWVSSRLSPANRWICPERCPMTNPASHADPKPMDMKAPSPTSRASNATPTTRVAAPTAAVRARHRRCSSTPRPASPPGWRAPRSAWRASPGRQLPRTRSPAPRVARSGATPAEASSPAWSRRAGAVTRPRRRLRAPSVGPRSPPGTPVSMRTPARDPRRSDVDSGSSSWARRYRFEPPRRAHSGERVRQDRSLEGCGNPAAEQGWNTNSFSWRSSCPDSPPASSTR